MSWVAMASQYFFDVWSLRDHVLQINEERRIVQCLQNAVCQTRDCGDPALWREYNQALNTVENLEHYFSRMAQVLESAVEDTVNTQKDIERLIEEGTYQLKSENARINI